ncbi:MAG: hypothetical protein AAGF83_01350 [Cyanobacteria bacterium P01_G01_bin.67]
MNILTTYWDKLGFDRISQTKALIPLTAQYDRKTADLLVAASLFKSCG